MNNSYIFVLILIFGYILWENNYMETFRGRFRRRGPHHRHRPRHRPRHRHRHRFRPRRIQYLGPVYVKRAPLWYYWANYSCKDGCTPEGCSYPDMSNPNTCVWASDCWGC